MLTIDIFIDFNKRSSYMDFRTLATAPMEIRGQCYLR
jgi:hypothetical protein